MIVQRYLLREILQSVIAVLAVLLFIYSSNRFVRFLTEAALGRTSTELLFQMLGLKLASNLALIAPAGVFLGAMFALGRLHRDSEVIAMTASGIGVRTLNAAVLWFSLACAALTAVLSLYVSPTVHKQYEVVRERAKEGYHVTGILPGRFKSFSEGEKVVYAGGISEDKRSLTDVFVRVRSPDGSGEHLIVSRRAYQTVLGRDGDRFIVLEDGHRYAGAPGDVDFTVTQFATHAVRLEQSGSIGESVRLDSMTSMDLWNSGRPQETAELQWRISLPISVVVLGLLAVPLARSSPRAGRYGKLFVAVLVYFLYNNVVGVARQLVESGDLPAAIGVWPVHVVVAACGLAMASYQSTGSWRVAAYLRRRRDRR